MQRTRKVKSKPNNIDIIVGKKLKALRLINGFSQEKIAQKLNLTFQQIQKYESGKNRISASRMYELSKILSVDVNTFFESLEEANDETANVIELNKLDKETIELLKLFQSISSKATRKSLLSLLKNLSKIE